MVIAEIGTRHKAATLNLDATPSPFTDGMRASPAVGDRCDKNSCRARISER